jgi:hypothetical protein
MVVKETEKGTEGEERRGGNGEGHRERRGRRGRISGLRAQTYTIRG